MMGRRRADDGGSMGTGSQDENMRQIKRDLIDEVRREADERGVAWNALLDAAELSKASRSRFNAGVAGNSTIGRVRRALDDLSAGVRDSDGDTRPRAASRDATGMRRRWVIVQRKDRQMFVGIASATDDEIADKGRVRLERCRPIQSMDVSPASLASIGPSSSGIAGPEAPSALVLDVAVVYDATKAAVRAFESR